MSVWNSLPTLQTKFRMEKLVFKKIPCEYRAPSFDDDCWDCGKFEWIVDNLFDVSLIGAIGEDGYNKERNIRFCANSFVERSTEKSVRSQILDAMKNSLP